MSNIGFVGKLPARADFVRRQIAERIGPELDRWLQQSVQCLQQGKAELPNGALRFVFSAPQQDALAVGVVARSLDQVGRSYPLAIFSALPVESVVLRFAGLPLAAADFLNAAADVLARASTLSVEELQAACSALVPPTAASLATGHARVLELLQRTAAGELFAELLAGGVPDGHAYALYTLCSATLPVQKAPPSGVPTVLDCPVGTLGDLGVSAWLELVRRRLSWTDVCPSFLWLAEPAPRALIALGHASEQLLHFAAAPTARATRLWPLSTDRLEAIARAQAALPDLGAYTEQNADILWSVLAKRSV